MSIIERLLVGLLLPPLAGTVFMVLLVLLSKLETLLHDPSSIWFYLFSSLFLFGAASTLFAIVPSAIYSLLMEFVVCRYVQSKALAIALSSILGLSAGLYMANIDPVFQFLTPLGFFVGIIAGWVLVTAYREARLIYK